MCLDSPWSSDTVCWCCWSAEPWRCTLCPGYRRYIHSSSDQTGAVEDSGLRGWWASWPQQGYRSGWRAGSGDTPSKYKKRVFWESVYLHFMRKNVSISTLICFSRCFLGCCWMVSEQIYLTSGKIEVHSTEQTADCTQHMSDLFTGTTFLFLFYAYTHWRKRKT